MSVLAAVAVMLLSAQPLRAQSIKLLTFNINGTPVIDPTRSKRISAITERLQTGAYDVALFQEAYVAQDRRDLKNLFFSSVSDEAEDGAGSLFSAAWGSGLVIASRWPIRKSHLFHYSIQTPMSKDFFLKRGLLAATVDSPAGEIDIYNTHLTHPPEAVTVRLAEIFELVEFVERFSAGRNFLLGGDLNFMPGSLESEFLSNMLGLDDACGWSDSGRCASTSGKDGRLDYIFLADRTAHVRSIRPSFTELNSENEPLYSDHFALEADLSPDLAAAAPLPNPRRQAEALRRLSVMLKKQLNEIETIGFFSGFWHVDQVNALRSIDARVKLRLAALN